MSNSWDNLPNAAAIDRVLADVSKNPKPWECAYDIMFDFANQHENGNIWNNIWIKTREDLKKVNRYDTWIDCSQDIQSNGNGGAFIVAKSTILALISNDEYGNLLTSDPDQLKVMMLLSDSEMLLLYPGCLALNNSKHDDIVSESLNQD